MEYQELWEWLVGGSMTFRNQTNQTNLLQQYKMNKVKDRCYCVQSRSISDQEKLLSTDFAIVAHTFDDSQATAAIRATFIFPHVGEKKCLLLDFLVPRLWLRSGQRKGGTGFGKGESYTAFHAGWLYYSITEKSTVFLLKWILHLCAGTSEALTFSTRAEQKAEHSTKYKKTLWAFESWDKYALAFAFPNEVIEIFTYHHIARGCKGHIGPFSCNLNWNYPSLFMRASAETGFDHDTFGENHLYLAWNQARRVISAGRHWAAAISCP